MIQAEVDLGREVTDTFHAIRKIGNEATHGFTSTHREAMQTLKLAWTLCVWYHRTFGDTAKDWKPGAFIKPEDPEARVRELAEKIAAFARAQQAPQRELNVAQQLAEAEAAKAAEAGWNAIRMPKTIDSAPVR